MYSPGPGLLTLDLGPSGPDLGPGPGPERDNENIVAQQLNSYTTGQLKQRIKFAFYLQIVE